MDLRERRKLLPKTSGDPGWNFRRKRIWSILTIKYSECSVAIICILEKRDAVTELSVTLRLAVNDTYLLFWWIFLI